jgi:hypothetical protein
MKLIGLLEGYPLEIFLSSAFAGILALLLLIYAGSGNDKIMAPHTRAISGGFYRKVGTMGTPKKGPGRPNTVPVGNNAAQKGNPTPKPKKTRSTARYVEVKIRITREEFTRGLPYFENEKYLGRFVLDAVRKKINRAESHDKTARLSKLLTDETLLLPVLKHMQETGKLNFLMTINREGTE